MARGARRFAASRKDLGDGRAVKSENPLSHKQRARAMTDVDVRSPGSVDSAEHKRKHIVWNEDNLSYNEANKSVSASPRPPDPAAPIRAPAPLFSPTP